MRWSRTGLLQAATIAVMLSVALVTQVAALEIPSLAGRVADRAGLIPEPTRLRIEQKLRALENRTGAQVVVYTEPSLEREAIEEYTIRVVEKWGLGQADQDNGVLLFVAQKERRLRLEVGYGLEGELTDVLSGRILDNIVTPAFRQGDFGGGLDRAVDAIIAVIDGAEQPPALQAPQQPSPFEGCFVFLLIFFLFVVLPMLLRFRDHRRGWSSRRGWAAPWIIGGGGSSGGGFGGFSGGGFGGFSGGGGGFGGGGASGGW